MLLFYQLVAGLAHVHSRSIVHRDLKPSNIFLTPAPRAAMTLMAPADAACQEPMFLVKLGDFGARFSGHFCVRVCVPSALPCLALR